jgi:uncharacterized membrane protein YfcA
MTTDFVWLMCFVLVSYTTLAISGFGSVIIAITLGVHFYPIEVLLPILVPLTLITNSYITIKYHNEINTTVLFRKIIPFMGSGLLVGVCVFHFIQGILLKKLFGFLIVFLSTRELYRLFIKKSDPSTTSSITSSTYIVIAGIIHGIYASGGPLLVYAINKLGLNKTTFRSTLSSLWILLNIVLTSSYIFTGKITADSAKVTGMLLPVVLIGLIIGEILHQYINEYIFKIFVFMILLFSGLSILIK